jgi:hypothetical protein
MTIMTGKGLADIVGEFKPTPCLVCHSAAPLERYLLDMDPGSCLFADP